MTSTSDKLAPTDQQRMSIRIIKPVTMKLLASSAIRSRAKPAPSSHRAFEDLFSLEVPMSAGGRGKTCGVRPEG